MGLFLLLLVLVLPVCFFLSEAFTPINRKGNVSSIAGNIRIVTLKIKFTDVYTCIVKLSSGVCCK